MTVLYENNLPHTGVSTPSPSIQGGRICEGPEHNVDLCQDMSLIARMNIVEQNFMKWWRCWYDQVWESLIPVSKWRKVHPNLGAGDIVLLKYENKVSAPVYRYGKVLKAHPDDHGVVRTVTVGTRPRRAREPPRDYIPRKLDEQIVPIQRLVLLLPAEQLEDLPEASEDVHVCEEELRVPQVFRPAAQSPLQPGPTAPTNADSEPPGPTESRSDLAMNFFRAMCEDVTSSPESRFLCWQCDTREQNLHQSERDQTWPEFQESS